MHIEQIYTGCLAQGAYYIESNGEAAVIDPLRESAPYVEKAAKRGAKIKYIFETHFHADFVSGHVDLAQKTGAVIVYGPGSKTNFDFHEAKDAEVFVIGNIQIKVLHTPGHTLESSTYLLFDEDGQEKAIFSGDTLFIGDVGRPDLAQKVGSITQEDLAGMLYDSLRNKIMPLPDHVVVYPAHGAGSACGKNMSKETSDLLGNQKKHNYALREDMSKAEFIKEVTDGLLPPPQYFAQNVAMNKAGDTSGLDTILEKGNVGLDVATFESIANHEGALVLDTRHQKEFVKAHIPNAIFIGIDGSFAPWVGALIPDLKQPIIFIAEEGREEEIVTRLSRVGYDNTLGYLKGGIEAWKAAGKETETLASICSEVFAKEFKAENLQVLDVRKPTEYEAEHLETAGNLPLDFINENFRELDKDKLYHIHCQSGYRSVIASSIYKSRGLHNIVNVEGGIKGIKEVGLPTTAYVCPTTQK